MTMKHVLVKNAGDLSNSPDFLKSQESGGFASLTRMLAACLEIEMLVSAEGSIPEGKGTVDLLKWKLSDKKFAALERSWRVHWPIMAVKR